MHSRLLEILACPRCSGGLTCEAITTLADGEIEKGLLRCESGDHSYEIFDGIPRFVARDNYASSFGYQWNQFRAEQIDSINGTRLSEKRFYTETNWTRDWLKGKWILDAGCGAGRFLDVASKAECEVVGIDISNAVDAARTTLRNRKNLHLIQASIYELPFRSEVFDGCYCIGVLQHTPDPAAAIRSLPRVSKQHGRIVVTIYERNRWTRLNTKYLIRPITKRVPKKLLLGIIKILMPFLFPLTEVLFRIPYLGRLFSFTIPVANYVNEPELNLRQRYRWAVLDTFDMLSPQYDQPQTESEARQALLEGAVERVERRKGSGLNLSGEKSSRSQTSPNAGDLVLPAQAMLESL